YRGTAGAGALGEAGRGHFQRRGRAEGTAEDADIEPESLQRGETRRVRSGGIEARTGVIRLGRRADDAGVNEGRTGRRDDGGDALGGTRAHRVAVDVDRLAVAGSERRGGPAAPGGPAPPGAGGTG